MRAPPSALPWRPAPRCPPILGRPGPLHHLRPAQAPRRGHQPTGAGAMAAAPPHTALPHSLAELSAPAPDIRCARARAGLVGRSAAGVPGTPEPGRAPPPLAPPLRAGRPSQVIGWGGCGRGRARAPHTLAPIQRRASSARCCPGPPSRYTPRASHSFPPPHNPAPPSHLPAPLGPSGPTSWGRSASPTTSASCGWRRPAAAARPPCSKSSTRPPPALRPSTRCALLRCRVAAEGRWAAPRRGLQQGPPADRGLRPPTGT